MNLTKLNDATLRSYIPNVFAEAEGEASLFDKLQPYIASSRQWLETDYIGPEDYLSDVHNELALKIVVYKAFADAVPSLDLSLTANGFAVISTDNLAPASKERVERLIASLHSSVSANLNVLLDVCRRYPQWHESEPGRSFGSTFIYSPEFTLRFPEKERPDFLYLQSSARSIESSLELDYVGRTLMGDLRRRFVAGEKVNMQVVDRIVDAILSIVTCRLRGDIPFPLSYYARGIVYEIKSDPELEPVWREEVGDKAASTKFVNNIKGSYYF